MKSYRYTFLVVAVGGLLFGCGLVGTVAADQPALDTGAGQSELAVSTSVATPGQYGGSTTTVSEHHGYVASTSQEQTAADGDHDEGGEHGGTDEHGGADTVHLVVEGLQILFALAAVVSVVLAGRVYGGEVGRALLVSGVGVTLFATQRLWHNLHELGLLGRPTALGEQALFILAAGALAAGYLALYRTMTKRTG